jgi:hypothetical protein
MTYFIGKLESLNEAIPYLLVSRISLVAFKALAQLLRGAR